jgi:type I restriction enzyme, S subunit
VENSKKIKEFSKNAEMHLDEYLKSVFNEMFGNPTENNKKFIEARVGDVCGCIVPGRDKPKSFTGKIPWVTTEDLNFLGVTYKSKKDIGLTMEEIKNVRAKIIPKNSVLLTCVGNLGIVSVSEEEMVINQQLHAFQCPEEINALFLMYVLSQQKNYMYSRATSTTVPYMNKTVCNSIPIIIPPLLLQQKFAKIVEQVEKMKENVKKTKANSEELFNSLMQKTFRGEL